MRWPVCPAASSPRPAGPRRLPSPASRSRSFSSVLSGPSISYGTKPGGRGVASPCPATPAGPLPPSPPRLWGSLVGRPGRTVLFPTPQAACLQTMGGGSLHLDPPPSLSCSQPWPAPSVRRGKMNRPMKKSPFGLQCRRDSITSGRAAGSARVGWGEDDVFTRRREVG